MKRHISLLAGTLVFASGVAQTSYTNFINTVENGESTVFPVNDILNISIDTEKPGALNINLKDNTKKHFYLGDSGKSKFINISPELLLAELYSYQYYGLPYGNSNINSASPYTGKFDALTDLYQIHWSSQNTMNYYSGNMDATKTPLMSYTKDLVWECVNKGLELIKNLESLDSSNFPARDSIMAETKCIIAQHYFDLFMHYGGLPIIKEIDSSNNYHMGDIKQQTDNIYNPIIMDSDMPWIHNRSSIDETVEYMVGLIDEAIPYLKWEGDKTISTLNTERMNFDSGLSMSIESRRWSKAGAMALKAKILLFAASPIFNADKPYYSQTSEQQKPLVWYGNYDAARWQRALEACRDFFKTFEENGYYDLVKAQKQSHAGYRQAFRNGYWDVNSKEVLMASRVSDFYGAQGSYSWLSWNGWTVNRLNHSPSEEYAEMFGWSDGTPFRWKEDSISGKVDGIKGKLFFEYKEIRGGFTKIPSRDPRMYENLICTGQLRLSADGTLTGNIYELWRGGADAEFNVIDASGNVVEAMLSFCPTGYGPMKYVMSKEEILRSPHHWVMLSLNEMYLMYAEALAHTGNLADAIKYIDIIRARVGLKSLATCYSKTYGIDLSTNKELLLEEILRERACELGMSNNRFFDMVRYKRTDWMTRQLHGLASIRMIKNSNNEWVERNSPWFGDDKNSGLAEPTTFKFYRFPLQSCPRALWGKDKDSDEVLKWLLSPLPQEEIDKGLGLIQNPGW